jgi:hypothetical protein
MRPHDPPDDLTPDQRFQYIAALLAAGLRRLRPRAGDPAADGSTIVLPNNLPELSLNCLELPGQTRLSGHTG